MAEARALAVAGHGTEQQPRLASPHVKSRPEAAACIPQHVLYSSMTHAFSLFSFSFPPLEWVWPGLPTMYVNSLIDRLAQSAQ